MSISSASAILISDDSSSGIDALQLGGESIKKKKITRGVAEGDYSREAINRGTAIIQGNTVRLKHSGTKTS